MIRFATSVVLLLAAALAAAAEPALKAGTFEPPRMAPNFELQGSTGSKVALEQFRGKIVLLGFGFTHCAEVCPITLHTLAQANRKLGPKASDVQVLYVTVDPERDDPARMKQYLAAFDPAFVGATGTAAELAAVRKAYGVSAQKVIESAGGYKYGHSSFVYLIDRVGKLRALMPYGHDAEDYVHDVGILLGAP